MCCWNDGLRYTSIAESYVLQIQFAQQNQMGPRRSLTPRLRFGVSDSYILRVLESKSLNVSESQGLGVSEPQTLRAPASLSLRVPGSQSLGVSVSQRLRLARSRNP